MMSVVITSKRIDDEDDGSGGVTGHIDLVVVSSRCILW